MRSHIFLTYQKKILVFIFKLNQYLFLCLENKSLLLTEPPTQAEQHDNGKNILVT